VEDFDGKLRKLGSTVKCAGQTESTNEEQFAGTTLKQRKP